MSGQSEHDLPPEEQEEIDAFRRSRDAATDGFRRIIGSRGIGRETVTPTEEKPEGAQEPAA
jgi:hypothetical protein